MERRTSFRVDVEKAVRFVRQHGNKINLIRLRHFLGERMGPELEPTLKEYQYPNGGWCYEDDPKRVVSIGASSLWLRVLLEVGLKDAEMVGRTAEFLLGHQEPDGSWYELEEKLELSPQQWLNEDLMDNRLWFTISTTVWLMEAGFESHSGIRRSTRYLSDYWDEHGKFRVTGYPYWAGLPFFAKTMGIESEAFSSCYNYTLDRIEQYNAFLLGWVLNMCKLTGLPASDGLVKASLDRLESLQGQDGAWESKYGDSYCTLFALNMLRHYGRIERPDS